MSIRTLIVDDEPLARTRIKRLLEKESDVEIVGEAENGLQALKIVDASRPDLLFLDINMPEMNGLEFVSSLPHDDPPAIVFVTAFDQHAVHAFSVNALDYLLKPFDEERFQTALERARERLRTRGEESDSQLEQLMASLRARNPQSFAHRLVVKHLEEFLLIPVGDIDCIQAAGKLVRIHVGDKEYSLRETLQNLEDRLDPSQFARIHRSAIVNLDSIDALEPTFNGEFQVRLRSGVALTLSRSYRARLNERLGNSL